MVEIGVGEGFGFEEDFLEDEACGACGVVLGGGDFAVSFFAASGDGGERAAQGGGADVEWTPPGNARKCFAAEPEGGEAEVDGGFDGFEVVGEVFDFGNAAAGLADEAADVAEIGHGADGAAVARGDGGGCAADAGGLVGDDGGEFELIAAGGAPCVFAAAAEFGGEFSGVSVDGKDAAWAHAIDAFEQAWVVGVVGHRDDFIDAIAVVGGGLECPAAEHGGAGVFQAADQARAKGIGWNDEGVAWGDGCAFFEDDGGGERRADLAADARHFRDGGVEDGGDAVFV